MTNDDYTRMRFRFSMGRYWFFWRLMTFPLATSWRQRMSPMRIDWDICLENPHQETVERIVQLRRHLAEHPKDIMNQFILGNVLRMDGQIAAAREQYQQVVSTGHGHWVQQAADMIEKLEGVPDFQAGPSMTMIYRNSFHRFNREYNPWKTPWKRSE